MDINAIERQNSTPGLISGTMLVIATIAGDGMFSLPIAMAGVWFPGASVILLFIAIMMLLTGLMPVEVNLHYGAGAGFNTFTQDLLGHKWNIAVGIAFGLVLYILTYAYISKSPAVMTRTAFKYSGACLLANISVVIVSMSVGAITWYNSLLVGRITTVLITGKFIAFFATSSGLIGHIEVAKPVDSVAVAPPNSQYLPYILMTLSFCITSSGLHGSVLSLVKLCGKSGVPNITRSIIIGTLFALLLYIFWLGVTMGNISRSVFPPIIAEGDNIDVSVEAIGELFTSRYMDLILTSFGNFAVASSLLVTTLGLFNYIADLFHLPDDGMGRLKTALATYFLPVAVCFFFPNGFVHAVGHAGLAFAIWSVILPPLLVKAARRHFPTANYTASCNDVVLNLVTVCGAVAYLTVVLDVSGLLSTSRQTESK